MGPIRNLHVRKLMTRARKASACPAEGAGICLLLRLCAGVSEVSGDSDGICWAIPGTREVRDLGVSD